MSNRSAHISRKVTTGDKKHFAKLKKKRAKSNNHHVNKYDKNGGNKYKRKQWN